MAEKRRLFKEAERDVASRVLPSRRVSFFAGRVFRAQYGVRNSPNTYTNIFGRLIDLQPAMKNGKVAGIILQYRMAEMGKDGSVRNHRDKTVHDLPLGPFDTVIQMPATATIKDSPKDKAPAVIPLGNGENEYALIHANRAQGQEDRFFQISFELET